MVVVLLLITLFGCDRDSGNLDSAFPEHAAPKTTPVQLLTARHGFETKLRVRGKAPDSKGDAIPPKDVSVVTYKSSDIELKAFLSLKPEGDGPHPAVVFLHPGFALWPDDWPYAEPYLDAGFVVLMPSTRGDCGNPGVFEAFFGEVEDVIAAGDYVQSLPYVDPNQVFVAGHSAGGVLAVLAMMCPSKFRAAAAIDPSLDMHAWAQTNPDEYVVFNRRDSEEIRLRNPLEFVDSVRREIILFSEPEYTEAEKRFTKECQRKGKKCSLTIVPGDHNSIVPESQRQIVDKFRKIIADDSNIGAK